MGMRQKHLKGHEYLAAVIHKNEIQSEKHIWHTWLQSLSQNYITYDMTMTNVGGISDLMGMYVFWE